MKRIKRAATFFLIMTFIVLIYAIIQTAILIKQQQYSFTAFLQLAFMLIPYLIMWGFADATYEALGSKANAAYTKEDQEVLDNYTDQRS